MPLISVIIPIYKVEPYLNHCVDSVLLQDFKDIEVILVDDGSPDECPKICDMYAQKDDRIKVIHKNNGGLSSARNAGIRIASGDYLMFLDSDDWWNTKASLAKMIEFVNNNSSVELFIFDSIDYCEDNGTFLKRKYLPPTYEKKYATIDAYRYFVKTGDLREAAFNKILKRKVVLDSNLFFKEGIVSEDIEWMYRLMRVVQNISFIPYDLIYYRMGRVGSISNSVKAKNILDMLSIVRESVEYYKINPSNNEIGPYELECCAKLWFTVLGLYQGLTKSEKQNVVNEIKTLSFVIEYSMAPKTIIIKKIYKYFGFSLTVAILSIYNLHIRVIANKKRIKSE